MTTSTPVLAPPETTPTPAPLSLRTKVGYGLGNLAVMVGKQAPKQLSLPIYNVALGVNPGVVGTLLALSRVWDAFTDPFVGHWSDRVRTRWGRRKPFIFVGAILTALFFASMWMFPRGMTPGGYVVYYAVSSLFFYLALTVFSVPWYAMGYELARTYDERTRLMAFPAAIGPLGQILVGWLYWFTQLDYFEDTIEGVRYAGTGAGLILLIFGLMPVLLVRESGNHTTVAPARPRAERWSFFRGVRDAMRNGPFMRLTVAFTLVIVGTSMVGGLGFYVHAYYLFGGDTRAAGALGGWHMTVMLVCSMLATPLAARLSVRFGKKEIFLAALVWAAVRTVLLWFLLQPNLPWLVLLNSALNGVDNAAIFMLCHAMIADVCDFDELENGTRREGLFGALYGWFFKTGIALAFGVSGYVLVWIGFNRDLGGNQDPQTLWWMKTAYCGVPALAFLMGLAVLARYPISRRVAEDVRLELARRHADTLA
jgi:glycoside/pentoside/hexuronide:cation symporter, GPH family